VVEVKEAQIKRLQESIAEKYKKIKELDERDRERYGYISEDFKDEIRTILIWAIQSQASWEMIEQVLKILPLDMQFCALEQYKELYDSLYLSEPSGYGSFMLKIRDWIASSKGYFNVTLLDKELEIKEAKARVARRVALHRLVEKGELERHPERNGIYRLIERNATAIKWQNADPERTLKVALPFGLEQHVTVLPGDIIVLAGVKGAGKTALVNEFIKNNMDDPDLPLPIYLWCSEGSEVEIHRRRRKHEIPLEAWKDIISRRTQNFKDVIVKDYINIIDYLEIRGGEYYLIRDEIAEIYERLGDGLCLIVLQKPFGRELGLGGQASIERSRLYLSVDKGILTVIDAKNWEGAFNPNGLKIYFKITDGTKILKIREEWRYEKEE